MIPGPHSGNGRIEDNSVDNNIYIYKGTCKNIMADHQMVRTAGPPARLITAPFLVSMVNDIKR